MKVVCTEINGCLQMMPNNTHISITYTSTMLMDIVKIVGIRL